MGCGIEIERCFGGKICSPLILSLVRVLSVAEP
jgi:hypothetical protein